MDQTQEKRRPGRPEGSMNRLAKESREKAKETGALPHELLLQWGRGEPMTRKVMGPDSKRDDPGTWVTEYVEVEPETMRDSAKAAAPYYAPKIATIEVTQGISDADLDEFIARSAAEAGLGDRFGREGQAAQGVPGQAPEAARTARRVRL